MPTTVAVKKKTSRNQEYRTKLCQEHLYGKKLSKQPVVERNCCQESVYVDGLCAGCLAQPRIGVEVAVARGGEALQLTTILMNTTVAIFNIINMRRINEPCLSLHEKINNGFF